MNSKKKSPPETVPLDGYFRLELDMMEKITSRFYQLMSKRRSIREFSPIPVGREIIEMCLRAAGTAPSGANHQPWHFVAISNPDVKRQIRLAAEGRERDFYEGRASEEWLNALAPLGTDEHKPFLQTAPWLIAIFSQRRGGEKIDQDKKNYYVTESVGLATGLLITALHSAGLGILTYTPSPMDFLCKICQRPDTEKPFVLLAVGHPADGARVPAHARTKKRLSEISTFID